MELLKPPTHGENGGTVVTKQTTGVAKTIGAGE